MKRVNSKSDLAVNGAEPAFAELLHVGRPNVGNRDTFLANIGRILDNNWLTNNGPMVQEFEQRVAQYLGVEHCVAMCNGTIALEIAIRALGLNGEVIVPSWTFVATAHALYWQGITPVFADIDMDTHNLDPDSVRTMITPRTSGIIGVHLWGRSANVEALQSVADEHDLKLMFDAAHAFGSSYKGKSIGQFGECEVFSFHATKAFNTMEGGAVTTNNHELAETLRLMRNFGFKGYDNVIHPGTNGKMIEACAAMGLANIASFDSVTEVNRANHEVYRSNLCGIPGLKVLEFDSSERNSHHYIVLEISEECGASRDELVNMLHAENVLARKYFWPGSHRMQPYKALYPHSDLVLPHTLVLSERVLILPNGQQLSSDEIRLICSLIRQTVQ
ncbi:aminotransferase class I/II-fold pyridoxal phosphate-dependent enzyme [Lysobacter sp. HDW10]|uniref:DegT/DnrJ/EryC1/StrS family aminotransferase n=1 Tax=Lysobacter sp. HDW10 TaxID=2714936 RepID=UPI0014089AEC|nr:DegT/DnrJ/EryC1/StrS family aminotransferase [Lysobacter sp. HDW10]QIK80346.1 aminotransferase class I/II-fold pyridoxal phosphate-dependent enzyme [Lysobacter sp. HDW10]